MRNKPPKSHRPDRRHPPRGSAPDRAGKMMPREFRPPKPAAAAHSIPSPSVARHALLYGVHAVSAAWLNPGRICRHLYVTDGGIGELRPALDRAAAAGLTRPQPIIVDRDALDRLLPQGAVHQGLALDAEPLEEIGLEDVLIAAGNGPLTLVLLDQVTDPHNVGAILRSAAAFGAKAIIGQKRHAPEITGVLAKAASGAVDVVPILRETNLARALEELRAAGMFVVGMDERADKTIAEADLPERVVLAMGAEGSGLRRLIAEGCDLLARLPTEAPIASLNVSNAAAVGLYEIARRRAR